MRFILFEPDMPQNTGAMLRLAACLGFGIDIIEPLGFIWDDRRLRRVAMDYADGADLRRFSSWETFWARESPVQGKGRILLLSTQGDRVYTAFSFRADDRLLLGRESAGVPETVHNLADARLRVPLASGARSLNVVIAAAMAAGEALRQIDGFPSFAG